MKNFLVWVGIILSLVLSLGSCDSDQTYEKQLTAEKNLISKFIKENNIQVVSSLPANDGWGTNIYYKTSDGLYIHIVDTGEVNTRVKYDQLVLARYYRISLEGDTVLRLWTTAESPYPDEITYDSTSTTPCRGFQEAIQIMKRHNSVAKIIVPSEIGSTTEQNSVTPYFYDLKIKLAE